MNLISIHQRHPLHRQGSNRVARMLKALSPDYFKLDDRSMQDIIVAAHRYAQQLSYIDENNRPDGDWSAFWEVETLTYLAVLSALDTDELRRKFDDTDIALANALESYNPKKGKPNPVPGLHRDLLNLLFDMAKGLEEMYEKLVGIKHPMQSMVLNLIKRDNQCDFEELQGALQKLIALHKGADDKLVHERYNIFYAPDNRWGVPDRKHYDLIKPDVKITREKMRALFITFFNAYLLVSHRGQQAFDAELALMEKPESEAYRIVQPHISLFIAFLRLFRYAQDSLNELTKKQLDYYYENILCLGRRKAEPDHVHLIFTLAKNFDQELIEKGTQLLGGKDKNGQPMYYETLQDWVVTQAQVEEVKTVFVAKRLSFNTDGLTDDEKFKSILGKSCTIDGSTPNRILGDDRLAPEAEIGLAIHSPQLWLEEGNRWFEINISELAAPLFNLVPGDHPTDYLALAVSTKKGWVYLGFPQKLTFSGSTVTGHVDDPTLKQGMFQSADLENFTYKPFPTSNSYLTTHLLQACYAIKHDGNTMSLQVFLPADFDALESVEDEKASQLPGVKLVLKKNAFKSLDGPYEKLLTAQKHAMTISVRAEGVSKSLIIQTDNGPFDGTQQVLPFGASVPHGAKFYVGNQAFLKKLDKLRFNIDWVGANALNYTGYASGLPNGKMVVGFLDETQFKKLDGGLWEENLVSGSTLDSVLEYVFSANLKRGNPNYNLSLYDSTVRRGFMQFKFIGDFGHGSFAELLAKKSIYVSKQPVGNVLGQDLLNPPHTPTFNSIKMDYISMRQKMEQGFDELVYLHPFGGYEHKSDYLDKAGQIPQSFSLFPNYTVFNGINKIDGHLYLGLKSLIPGSNVSFLVQTAEGSERNADADTPRLHWSYLRKNNEWMPISPLKILLDSTGAFTRAGVIQLSVPEDISNEGNTLLNPDLLWLRVSAEEGGNRSAAALPDLLHISTQVIEAALRMDEGIAPAHLTDGLAASSLSKLVISRSSVKKIAQPAPSFDGREAEADGLGFYVRICERLRHRNRAITAWDYEYLTLSKFPDVATALCVNHTQYKLTPASELAPGFVTVSVIPDLRKRTGISLENPRFPKGDLDEMRDYLNDHANLFVNESIGDYKFLQLANPQYEHLHIAIKVQFQPGVDESFYKLKLSDDLRDYLAPWLKNIQNAPVFGRNLRKSAIIRFVEDLPYIDYIIGDVIVTKAGKLQGEDIKPDAAHGILTTAAKHNITT